MRKMGKTVVSVLCVSMVAGVVSSYGGDLVVDGTLTVNGATKVDSLMITNIDGAVLSVDRLESVDAIEFHPIYYQTGIYPVRYEWITNSLSVVNTHAVNSYLSGSRGSNKQSLRFGGQLLATTPLDDPYFMYLDTIVGMGAEIGSADCISEVDDFGDSGVISGLQGGYLKLKALQYGYFERNSATLQISGDVPNEIDVSGHFDMQGSQIRNGVFVGDGSHLTGVKAEQWGGGAFDVDVDMGSNELENVSALKFKPEYLRTGSSTYTYVTNGLSIRNINRLYFNDEQVAMVDDRFNRLHIDGYVEIGGQYRPGTSGTCDGYLTLKSSNGGTAYDSATLRLSSDVEGEIDVYGSLDMQGSTISDGVFAGDGSLLTGVKAEEWQGGTVENDIDLSGNILENMSVIKFEPAAKQIGSSEYTYITNSLAIRNSQHLYFNDRRVALYSEDFNRLHIDGYVEIGGQYRPGTSGTCDGYLTLKSSNGGTAYDSATLRLSSDVEGEIDVYGSLDMQGSPIKNGVFVGNGAGLTDIPSSAITETDPVWQAEKSGYIPNGVTKEIYGSTRFGSSIFINSANEYCSHSIQWDGGAQGGHVMQAVVNGGMALNGQQIVTEDDLVDYVQQGEPITVDKLEGVEEVRFEPIRMQIGWVPEPRFEWVTNSLSVVTVHQVVDPGNPRNPNRQSLQFDDQLLATTPIDDPYFMYLDTIVGRGMELGMENVEGTYAYAGYLTFKSSVQGMDMPSATLRKGLDTPKEIDVDGNFDMQGNQIVNGVFVGNGAGLTAIPSSAITESDPVWDAEKSGYVPNTGLKVIEGNTIFEGDLDMNTVDGSVSRRITWSGGPSGVIEQQVVPGGMALNGDLIVTEDDLVDFVVADDLADFVTSSELDGYVQSGSAVYSGTVGNLYVPQQGDLGMGDFTAGAK